MLVEVDGMVGSGFSDVLIDVLRYSPVSLMPQTPKQQAARQPGREGIDTQTARITKLLFCGESLGFLIA